LAVPARTIVRSPLTAPVAVGDSVFEECGKPRVYFSSRLRRDPRTHKLTIAEVACITGCEVRLTVRDARHTIRTVTDPDINSTVTLPRRTRLTGHKARVTIVINRKHRFQRTLRLH
jgi:hypothetical protein